MEVRFQLGNDRLSHGAGRWLQDIVTGLWEETRSSGSCVAPEGLKNGMKKSRNSLQLSLRASTFCQRAQRYFHFLRINSPKLSQHCIHVCGTACSTLHCTGQRELRAGSCLTAPAFTITVWLAGRGQLRLVWGRSQCAEGLLHLGNATQVGIAHHPVLDHSRRRPASDDQPI